MTRTFQTGAYRWSLLALKPARPVAAGRGFGRIVQEPPLPEGISARDVPSTLWSGLEAEVTEAGPMTSGTCARSRCPSGMPVGTDRAG